MDVNLAFGDIFMVFNNQKKGLDTVTDYHRNLDITEATTTTSYTQDGTTFKRETFSQLSWWCHRDPLDQKRK